MNTTPIPRTRALTVIAGVLLLFLLLVPSAVAFDGRTGDQVVVGADEVIDDDFYAAAEIVTIDGIVRGDAIVAGREVRVNGTVEGNLMAVGQTVVVNGTVRGTARVAGQAVLLDTQTRIGRDLLFGGYSLEQRNGATVGRDAAIGGYQALLGGAIERNLRGGMAGLELRGPIGGNVDVELGDASQQPAQFYTGQAPTIGMPIVRPGLTMADTARIRGQLRYTATQQFPIRGAVGRDVVWNARTVNELTQPTAMTMVLDNLRRLIARAIVGLLLVWLAPRWTQGLANTAQARPLPTVGYGLLAAVVALATVIGLVTGTAVLAVAFGATTLFGLMALTLVTGLLGTGTAITAVIAFTTLVAPAVVSYMAGRRLLERAQPTWATHGAAPLLVGLPIYVVLTAIPVLGGLVGVIAALLALGALWTWVSNRRGATPAALPAEPHLAVAA